MLYLILPLLAIGQIQYVAATAAPGSFPIVQGGNAAGIRVDPMDWPGVLRAAGALQADVARVTNSKPALVTDTVKGNLIIIGTIGRSRFNPAQPSPDSLDGLVEGEGYVSVEAEHYTRNIPAGRVRCVKSTHTISDPGCHTLKVWAVDPAVVLQKIVVELGGVKPGYLGPPQSYGRSGGPVQSKSASPPNLTRSAGAFATGTYRNLFVEAGHSRQETAAKIDAAFQQLFHGDPDTQTVYYPAGSNANGALAYLSDINNNDVRSEGMSYGMMIAVQLDKKAEFDALWNWARTYMYHDQPGHPARGFFSWSMRTDGTPNEETPAPDGEEYFAMALYFASGRWGNGTGIFDYQAAADRLLTDMRHREVITGPTSRGTRTGGNMFNPEYAMVRFTPDTDFTDPSYHVPAFYELWARWGPAADRPFWAQAAAASRDFFQKVTHPATGLAPDYANFDGTLRGGVRDNFQYDAWRTAMNWSVDWSWWARDARERQLSDRLQAFFESKGMAEYGNLFTLDGTQLGSSHSTGLVAMNAVASLAATLPRARQFVEALWNLSLPTGRFRYYDGMLQMLALLHCSGEFRIWPPGNIDRAAVSQYSGSANGD